MEQSRNSQRFGEEHNPKRSRNPCISQSSDPQNNSSVPNNEFPPIENSQASIIDFQELPVGKSATNNLLSEYPDDYQPTTNVVEEIQPLIKRVISKAQKTRQEAYSELEVAFKNGELLSEYEQFLNDFITDSNLQAQEKGFKVLQAYVIHKQAITIQINPILKSIIEKGLISNRYQTIIISQNVLVQLFDKGDQIKNKVISYITEGISNKNIRIASASINSIIPLLNNYGITRIQFLKPFLREIQKLNEATTPRIKDSISNFFKQAYKWLGEAILFTVNKFTKVVQDQIKTFASSYKHQPMKPLRAKQSYQKIHFESGVKTYYLSNREKFIDMFNQRWCQDTLQLIQWADKKQAIDGAKKAFYTRKIGDKQTGHLVSFITRLLADENDNIMFLGLKLLNNLHQGLRKIFFNGEKNIFRLILSKFKNTKRQNVQEVHKALNSLLLYMPLEEMIDKIKQNLPDQAPDMKIETLNFIKNSMKDKKQITAAKSLIDVLKVLMNDATRDVREKSVEILCKIGSLFGVKVLGNIDQWINVPKDKIIKIKNQPQVPPMENEKNMNDKSDNSLNSSSLSTPNIKESKLSNTIDLDHSEIPIKYKKKQILDKSVTYPRLPSKISRIQTLKNSTSKSLQQLIQSNVNKLMSVLTELPPPYNQLVSPMSINATLLDQLFTPQGFDKYSDLFVQWLFWRFHIQRAQNVLILIEISKKILRYSLEQFELIVLLSGSLGALSLEQQVIDGFCSWSSIFYERGQQKDVFLFYINSLAKNQHNLHQIVKIIISSYSSVISEYLALISKTQILKKSKQLMRYLKQNYSNDLLIATGLCEMQSHPEIANRSSHVHSVSSPIHHNPIVSRTSQKSFNQKDFAHELISILNKQGLEKMKIALDKQSSSRPEQQRTDFNVEVKILMMELMKNTLQQQQFAISCFKEYANWFYSFYRQLKLQRTQLQRIFRAVVQILSKFYPPTPTQLQNIAAPSNAFLQQIFTIGDVRDLFYCVFEGVKQFQQKGQDRNMANLVYIKSINKIRQYNNFFKQNGLQTYKILLEHAVDYIAQTIKIYNPQNFTFKRIKCQILEYFKALQPSSKQITIDVLEDNKSKHAVVQFFDYIFIHIRQNNPVMMEIIQYQAMKEIKRMTCSPEEAFLNSKQYKKHSRQQIFQQ